MAKKTEAKPDSILFFLVLGLLIIGFLMLFSVSASISREQFGNTYYYIGHQFLFGVLPGFVLAVFFLKAKPALLKKWSLFFFIGNLILLTIVFLPGIGVLKGGASRWIQINDFSFQPVEFLKITLPLYLAAWLSKKKKHNLAVMASFFLILVPLIVILLLQPDFSTLVLVILGACVVYFLSETPLWHTFLLFALGIAGSSLLIVFKQYRMQRFLTFIVPKNDPLGAGFQVSQTVIAIGSGGLWGNGLGLSTQKFGFLPNVISDSIFAAFCEETGFIGPLVLISMFLFFLVRVLIISKRTEDKFLRPLGIALAAGILFQAFLNIMAMMAVVPLTGVPLPFISYGGTHLMVELAMVGMLLNISKHARN